jgi:transcriptional regulator with XRE-family HTH domain
VEVVTGNPQTCDVGKPQREVDPFRDELRNLREALGLRIRELRQERGWSQEEFAHQAHVHRTFAGSLERGEKNCSFHALVLIARSFGITLSELLTGLEARQPGAVSRGRRAIATHGNADRGRILKEVSALERAAQALKEIALARSHPSEDGARKTTRKK